MAIKKHDTFSRFKQSIRREIPNFYFVPLQKGRSSARFSQMKLKLQDLDLKAALLPSSVTVKVSNQLRFVCERISAVF